MNFRGEKSSHNVGIREDFDVGTAERKVEVHGIYIKHVATINGNKFVRNYDHLHERNLNAENEQGDKDVDHFYTKT